MKIIIIAWLWAGIMSLIVIGGLYLGFNEKMSVSQSEKINKCKTNKLLYNLSFVGLWMVMTAILANLVY